MGLSNVSGALTAGCDAQSLGGGLEGDIGRARAGERHAVRRRAGAVLPAARLRRDGGLGLAAVRARLQMVSIDAELGRVG